MTYALHAFEAAAVHPQTKTAEHAFTHVERVTLMAGGAALGAGAGVMIALATGQINIWPVLWTSAAIVVLGLMLANWNLQDALKRGAHGCAVVSIAHIYALLAWPLLSLYAPTTLPLLYAAPVGALLTLPLLASCWRGSAAGIYRMSAQALLVGTLASYQGLLLTLGT